jgi:hypothetical protein
MKKTNAALVTIGTDEELCSKWRVVDVGEKRYIATRSRSIFFCTWLEIDAREWVEFGWDTVPVKRRETLEAIDHVLPRNSDEMD